MPNDPENQPNHLIHGQFNAEFWWAEGNLDTGVKHQAADEFIHELRQFLAERGASRLAVTGPDGDLLYTANPDDEP